VQKQNEIADVKVFHDAKRNVVIYDHLPDVDTFLKRVDSGVRLSNGYVAAPATTYNLQMARYLGLPSLPPLEIAGYDYPGRYTPFNAQRVTANFLVLHPRAFVLSDMGTGKTLAALWASDFLMRHHAGIRALVVAPLSTLHRVWSDAIFENFLGRRTCAVLHGSRSKRASLLNDKHDFYVINPEGLDVLYRELSLEARPDIQIIIADEASMFKERTTTRHLNARKLLKPRNYLWLMSGTPTPNAPTDAYGLAKLINDAQGESFASFKNRTMMQFTQFVWKPRVGAHHEVHRLLQPSVRFSIDDCVDLPPCTTQRRQVELSDGQKKAYRDLKHDYVLMTKNGPITAMNEAVLRNKLIQMSAGAIYGEGRAITRMDAGPRIKALREVMEACHEKIIIFAPLTSVITMLSQELKDYSIGIVRGSSDDGPSNKERNETLTKFTSEAKPRVLIAHPRTMAHGLTLTAATTIVWYAPIDSTELYLQANRRINRPGQTKATTIVQLTSTPIETEIYRRLEHNESLQGSMLALAKGGFE
jgi:SNF2 family DNA or RNA helicase